MEETVTISVKIPKKLRDRIRKSRIKISNEVRTALETKLLEEEAYKLDEEIKKHKKIFDKVKIEDVIASIREDREQ